MKLWVPIDKMHIVSGIINEQGDMISDPLCMLLHMRDEWAPIFDQSSVDQHAIQQVLSHNPRPDWGWGSLGLPGPGIIKKCILSAKENKEGPDGICSSVYKADPEFCADLLDD
eukprot:978582-Karenia_brevis.AAC.1